MDDVSLRCFRCEGKIDFDHHGSMEVQFHHPDMVVEAWAFCSSRCVKRFVELTVFSVKDTE